MNPLAQTNIINEPGFQYNLCYWGDSITGTPEQLRRIGIGLDIHFPEQANGYWKKRGVDPRGFVVELRTAYSDRGLFYASISFPGRSYKRGTEPKQYSFGVELHEETQGNVFVGTADALVAAGIVPAGYFPGCPGMQKTSVTIRPDGTLGTTHRHGRGEGGRLIEPKSKGQRPTYRCTVGITGDVSERRLQEEYQRNSEWERKMKALPRPAPLIDHPDYRRPEKSTPAPKYRAEGNVLYLTPRSEWRAAQ